MGYLKSTAASLNNMAIAQVQMNETIHKMYKVQIEAHRGPTKLALREINLLCTLIAAPTLMVSGSRDWKWFCTNFTIQCTIRKGWNRLREI